MRGDQRSFPILTGESHHLGLVSSRFDQIVFTKALQLFQANSRVESRVKVFRPCGRPNEEENWRLTETISRNCAASCS